MYIFYTTSLILLQQVFLHIILSNSMIVFLLRFLWFKILSQKFRAWKNSKDFSTEDEDEDKLR